MDFPVDVLGSVSHEEMEKAAESYMSRLRYVSPDKAESFTLTSHRKIRVSLSNMGFVPIYGGDLSHKVLALFAPEDQLTVVALYLADRWWAVDNVLRTSDPSRTGLSKVRTVGERIVLYVLNRIVYRVNEMDKPEIPFLCHGQHDFAKILWKDGQAIGFYSVKPKDSLCNSFVSQCYQLPVMNSIFIRKCHRGHGHGLQILEDFVDSFKDDQLGLKYPLSQSMYKICAQYLYRYPADADLLWVVEGVGGPYQRENVASKLKTLALKVNRHVVTANGDHRASLLTGETDGDLDLDMEEEAQDDNCLDVTEDVVVVNKALKLIEDMEDPPVSTRTRSGGNKRGREETESLEESMPLKMTRLEDEDTEVGASTTTTAAEEEEGGGEEEEQEEDDDDDDECSGPVDAEAEAAVAPEAPVEKVAPEEEPSAQEVEEVNGELTDDQEEEEEEEAGGKEEVDDMAEEVAQEAQVEEVPQEPEAVLENGMTEQDVEMEEEEEDTIDTALVESEEPEGEEEAKETAGEEAPSAPEEAPSLPEPAPEEPSTSGEMTEEAEVEPPASTEPAEPEEVSAAPMKEEEEVEKAMEEPAKEVVEEEEVEKAMEEPVKEVVEEEEVEKAMEEPVKGEEEEEEEEEDDTVAMEEEQEEANPAYRGEEAVLLVGVADLSYQPPEDKENQPTAEEEEEGEQEETEGVEVEEKTEVEENTMATTEDEEVEERSSDEAWETRVLRRVGRGSLATPKRQSKRLSRVPAKTPEVIEVTEEEEVKATTTDEEEEAVEKSSAEEEEEEEQQEEEEQEEEEQEEPPVVDQRALRRKSRPIQSPPKARGKRRSKT